MTRCGTSLWYWRYLGLPRSSFVTRACWPLVILSPLWSYLGFERHPRRQSLRLPSLLGSGLLRPTVYPASLLRGPMCVSNTTRLEWNSSPLFPLRAFPFL